MYSLECFKLPQIKEIEPRDLVERNRDVQQLSRDMSDLLDIQQHLSEYIDQQTPPN